MKRIRQFVAATVAMAAASGIALLPALTSASPAHAAVSCSGTSLIPAGGGDSIRVPTVGNGTRNWHCQLGLGNAGTAVGRLQIALNATGCNFPPAALKVDGIYGHDTQTAVTNFQRANRITVDGIYGPVTATHLEWPISPGSPDFGSCTLIP